MPSAISPKKRSIAYARRYPSHRARPAQSVAVELVIRYSIISVEEKRA